MERSARVVSSVLEIDPPALIPQVRAALVELVEARVLADDVGKDVWQYAIGLARFDRLDIRERHLRWLIDKSYAQHALDTTRKGDRERKFTPLPDDHLPPGACLVITDRGLALAGQSFQAQARALDEPSQLPHWDAARCKLTYGRAVVIEFLRSAPNLECVLAAFERRGWPTTIDDPFPPDPEGGALQRVRDAVYALNQRRSADSMEFRSQSSGARIGWQAAN